MALEGGSASAGTGLAGAIASLLGQRIDGFRLDVGADTIDVLAEAIVEYIKDNADVVVTGVAAGADTASGTVQ